MMIEIAVRCSLFGDAATRCCLFGDAATAAPKVTQTSAMMVPKHPKVSDDGTQTPKRQRWYVLAVVVQVLYLAISKCQRATACTIMPMILFIFIIFDYLALLFLFRISSLGRPE